MADNALLSANPAAPVEAALTLVTLDCGHQHRSVSTAEVGQDHPCWSACDGVPTMRVARARRVVAVEVIVAPTGPTPGNWQRALDAAMSVNAPVDRRR